jgi:hypothetical protein
MTGLIITCKLLVNSQLSETFNVWNKICLCFGNQKKTVHDYSETFNVWNKICVNLLQQVQDGGIGVKPIQPTVGDVLVGGLGQVNAVPVYMCRWLTANGGARWATGCPRVVVVWPASAAARPDRLLGEPCRLNQNQSQYNGNCQPCCTYARSQGETDNISMSLTKSQMCIEPLTTAI